MADLSIEEANKIRLSMGLAPLPGPGASAPAGLAFKQSQDSADADDDPASTIETRSAAAGENWRKLQEEREAKRKREERIAALKKERERAARFATLEGKGLADEADEEDDLAWLKNSKKRQKKIAKAEQLQKQFEEQERQAAEARQYTETDLAGIKVGHELDQFDDGEDQILVLKDTAVDAEDDDELEAVALREKEKLQERLDAKRRKRAYDPNDVDESGQPSILAQYDEEIEGKKKKAFTLDGQGRTVEQLQEAADGVPKLKKVAISLDILKDDAPASDYMEISEVKIKKSKKKSKSKSSKRKRLDDEDDVFTVPTVEAADEMELEEPETSAPKAKKKNLFDDSFVDDDDLQAQLAEQRRQALKKRKKVRPEDIARQLREEATATPETPGVIESTELGDDSAALVIDDTTEFVHNLGANADEDEEEERRRKRRKSSRISNGVDSVGDGNMDEDGDIKMEQSYAEASERLERSISRTRSVSITVTGLEEEKTVDQGVGATLALLKQRGAIASTEAEDKNAQFRERQKFLADKHRAEEAAERLRRKQRETERNSVRWQNMSKAEREEWSRKNNAAADQFESRKLAEIFNKEYKPNIDLAYTDEFGRQLNQKEAFKVLSHQFHGKGSGNTKTKKHLEKIAAEKKKMAESTLETTRTGGISSAQDQQAKKHKLAGVRLQ